MFIVTRTNVRDCVCDVRHSRVQGSEHVHSCRNSQLTVLGNELYLAECLWARHSLLNQSCSKRLSSFQHSLSGTRSHVQILICHSLSVFKSRL